MYFKATITTEKENGVIFQTELCVNPSDKDELKHMQMFLKHVLNDDSIII